MKRKRIVAAAFSLILTVENSAAAYAMDEAALSETESAVAETEQELTVVTLNEVAHSIFYAPQYVAIELGYFEDEGIDLTVVTGFGADKTMTALISGEADIGFMGSESSIYT
ncbi:MAG: ABC transporter substrate-binding protein, partial [Lachnospiraceae bacterium]|nr:ABC transporter substrate-binding protein [Lachnospiraceae bacterium]